MKKERDTVLDNLILLKRYTYVQWISNKKILMLKNKTIFVFMEGLNLPHGQISLWEDRTFHYKVPFSFKVH